MKSIVSGVTLLPKPYADAHGLKRLPLTLYTTNRTTATDYSKVSRGLRFPLEIPGLCTRKECSGDTRSGQWRSRYTIHASRHSTDKVLRSHLLPILFQELNQTFLLISQHRCCVRTVSSNHLVRLACSL